MSLIRREFLQLTATGSAVLGFQQTAPAFWGKIADQAAGQENILVVVQLTGGNDGLNTIVPYTQDEYYKQRPKLAIPKNDVLKIDNEFGFNPALDGFSELLEAGLLGVVQGVGYAQPNRSHFESMDIWHTCQRKAGDRADGWLGRAIDQMAEGVSTETTGMHIGNRKQPLAVASRHHRVPSIRTIEQFRLQSQEKDSIAAMRSLAQSDNSAGESLLNFVQTSTTTAIDVSQKLQQVKNSKSTNVIYPESELAGKLKTVSQLIASEIGARVYYVEIDGFDTHAFQAPAHTALLRELGDALKAFAEDLHEKGMQEQVLTMCFSEFGRRVAQNASDGTDHGTAAPMFLIGSGIETGLIGKHPSLSNLDNGDLKFHTDFRQVYATILENWLNCDSSLILDKQYESLPLFVAS